METSYIAMLPQDLWWHILSMLPPFPFLQFSATCKQVHQQELRNKFFVAWFQGQGCAPYLSPQVTKTLKAIPREKYYGIVHNLVREFKIISLPNMPESTLSNFTSMLLCKSTENLLVCFQSGIVMHFLARPPYSMLQQWKMEGEFNSSLISEHNGAFFLTTFHNDSAITFLLNQNGTHEVFQSYANPGTFYYEMHDGYEIKLRQIQRAKKLSVRGRGLKWKKVFEYSGESRTHILRIAYGAVLVEHFETLHLLALETGETIMEMRMGTRTAHVRSLANMQFVEKGRTKIWRVAVLKSELLAYWEKAEDSEELYHVLNEVSEFSICDWRPTSATPISLNMHSNKIAMVYTDGSIFVAELPITWTSVAYPATVGFSGVNITAAEVTEDSRVFCVLSTGLALALDFTTTDVWTSLPEVLTAPVNSQLVNKIITTMLHKIGTIVSLVQSANSIDDLVNFSKQFNILQQWFREVNTAISHVKRLGSSSYISHIMSTLGRVSYLCTTVLNFAKKLSNLQQKEMDIYKISDLLRTIKIEGLLVALDSELSDLFPHFPLRKMLQDMKEKQRLLDECLKVVNWVTLAKKIPKSITFDKILEHKQLVKDELVADTSLHQIATDSVREVENIFTKDLSQSILNAVSSSDQAISSPSTRQNDILAKLYSLISIDAFSAIKPTVQTVLADFLEQFQLMGDLNRLNQTLAEKCVATLNSNPPPAEPTLELVERANNFLSSLRKARDKSS